MNSPRIAITTCKTRDDFEVGDDPVLAETFMALGVTAPIVEWDDDSIDWSEFAAVLIRSTWDYTTRIDEFVSWLQRVSPLTTLLNPWDVVRTNLDKLYLPRLAEEGVPTIPTIVFRGEPDDLFRSTLLDFRADHEARDLALKPALGAGAEGLLICNPGDDAQHDRINRHARDLLAKGPMLAQPFMHEVKTAGELSVVLIEGEPVTAVRKTPKDGDHRVQIEYGGLYEIAAPSPEALAVAKRAFAAFPAGALYARIDLITPDTNPRVIEAEFVEPELFFRLDQSTADTFARAVLSRIGLPDPTPTAS